MRTFPIALVAAALAIPSVGYAQDQGLVGGRVGNTPDSALGRVGNSPGPSLPETLPGSPTRDLPYGPRIVRAPQERAGYTGSIQPGQVVPESLVTTPRPDGFGSAFVGGHQVIIDPNSKRILRVIN